MQGCKHAAKYFNKDLTPKIIKSKDGKAILPGTKSISSIIADPGLA